MITEKIFSYKITTERPIKELVELRFKYIMERTGLEIDKFITTRLKANGQVLYPNSVLEVDDNLEYVHFRSDEEQRDINLEILYEDDYLIAIDKPDFMPVVPRTSHYFNSVAFRLWEQFDNYNLTALHRLDIETTGVLLVAKHQNLTSKFHTLFREKTIQKTYEAFVYGEVPSCEIIEGYIQKHTDSKIFSKYMINEEKEANSLTKIINIDHFDGFSKVELEPVTGKTNQLRIHLSEIGYPIIGDKKYYFDEDVYLNWLNTKKQYLDKMIIPSQALHAREVRFIHPFTGESIFIQSKNRIMDEYLKSIKTFYKLV